MAAGVTKARQTFPRGAAIVVSASASNAFCMEQLHLRLRRGRGPDGNSSKADATGSRQGFLARGGRRVRLVAVQEPLDHDRIDRFHQMVVETRLRGAFLVFFLAPARKGDHEDAASPLRAYEPADV